MSTRFATTIGLASADTRPSPTDVVLHRQPSAGALLRTKGSLFLLAQLRGDDPALSKVARASLEAIERDYYRDVSGGIGVALQRALATANRRLYEDRSRLAIPDRCGIGVVALVIRGREAYVVRLGEAAAVMVRAGRMYEVPPPPPARQTAGSPLRRHVASSLGEARSVEAYAWDGALSADDRLALISRDVARLVGREEMKRALLTMSPAVAADNVLESYRHAGGARGGGILAIHVSEEPMAGGRGVERIGVTEPVTGVSYRSGMPLIDAVSLPLRSAAAAWRSARTALASGASDVVSAVPAIFPRRRPTYPHGIRRTADRVARRRRRFGLAGTVAAAALVVVGGSVAALPSPAPRDAIPRAVVARDAVARAAELIGTVEERVSAANLVDRDPDRASLLLDEARLELERATNAGVPIDELAQLQRRLGHQLDALYRVTRIGEPSVVADVAAAMGSVALEEMVTASDGSLWLRDSAGGRIVRVDPSNGSTAIVYRAGAAPDDAPVAGEPWLMATAATDVVVIDRNRGTWRIDLAERIPRPMALHGAAQLSPATVVLAALQHRPPLELFTLYVVDARAGGIGRWSPPAVIPVEFPEPREPFLSTVPDRDPRRARDLLVDTSAWLLHADTVTRVDFGTPLGQDEYSLDRPPDHGMRPRLDYSLLDAATVGDRELLYVYDAGTRRIIAFSRTDGAFVRQWLAPASGAAAGALDDVRGLSVTSVADGPAVALLLSGGKVVRLVLE